MDKRILLIIEEEVKRFTSEPIDMTKLLTNIQSKMIQVESTDDLILSYKKSFNKFEREIDRKYAIYDFFRFLRPELGYKVSKYIGSNQVILEKNDKEIYNSDNEKSLANPEKFEIFFQTEMFLIILKGVSKFGKPS